MRAIGTGLIFGLLAFVLIRLPMFITDAIMAPYDPDKGFMALSILIAEIVAVVTMLAMTGFFEEEGKE